MDDRGRGLARVHDEWVALGEPAHRDLPAVALDLLRLNGATLLGDAEKRLEKKTALRAAAGETAGLIGARERIDWVNQALFAELLSRVEGDALESTMRRAVDRGVMRPEEHGKKAGFVIDQTHDEVRTILGEFDRLNGEARPAPALPSGELAALPAPADATPPEPAPTTATAAVVPRKRTRRGRRGGRGRRGSGLGPKKAATGEAAD